MSAVFEKPSWPRRLLPMVQGLVTMYSVGFDHGTRFVDHGRNMLLAAMHPVRGGAGAAAAPDGAGGAAVHRGRGAAGGHRAVRHHQEGRHALAQPGHGDPAQRAPEDRHAADAGLVVPAREGQLRVPDFRGGGAAAAGAGGPGGQAARPGHLACWSCPGGCT
jgi:hypothetical protein